MRVHILRCNNNNKFTNSNGDIIKKYDPTIKDLQFHYYNKIENKRDVIPAENIHMQFGGAIAFIKDGDKFIIDDGYRDILCGCGYLVYNNYDKERVVDKQLGINIRTNIMNDILASFDSSTILYNSSSRISIKGESQCYMYTINFSTTSDIVNRNTQRKENNIPVYPFDKNMDKYGTWYVSIFGEKKLDAIDTKNIKEFDLMIIVNMILERLNKLNPYKYCPLVIKRRIINWEGL